MLSATTDYLWVGGGVVLTLGLGVALLYWIDAEWQALDQRHRQSQDASSAPEAPAPRPPDESADPPD